MTRMRPFLALATLAGVAVAVGLWDQSDAVAAKGQVICKLERKGKKRVVSCPKKQLRGKRGRRGKRGKFGAPGPAGPAGAPAGAGSGLSLNFNAYLTASKAKELTIGNFTVTAAAKSSGACEPIKLRAGSATAASRYAIGAGGEFAGIASNASVNLTNGKNSNMFTAVSDNGSSTMSGIVGAVTVGNVCLVSGYVTGI